MSCAPTCKLCNKIRISQSVTFTGGTLVVNLPSGDYVDGCKYCIVIAQSIPDTATINAPVVFTIGTGTVLYQLYRCDCTPATAANIHARTRYSTKVETTSSGGIFRLLGKSCSGCDARLGSINGTAPASVTEG